MPKKPIIIISVLCVISLALGYLSGLKEEESLSNDDAETNSKKEPEFLKEGLVAYYPFNGNANDKKYEEVALSVDRHGSANSAFSFFGAGIKIQNLLLPQGADSRTLSLWVRARVFLEGTAVIAQWGQPNYNEAFGVYIKSGKWMGGAFGPDLSSDIDVSYDWYHVVLGFEDELLRVFVNGILCAEDQRTLNSTGLELSLACEVGSFDKYAFKGELDDVRIYNRALSAEEVKALYEFEKAN